MFFSKVHVFSETLCAILATMLGVPKVFTQRWSF